LKPRDRSKLREAVTLRLLARWRPRFLRSVVGPGAGDLALDRKAHL